MPDTHLISIANNLRLFFEIVLKPQELSVPRSSIGLELPNLLFGLLTLFLSLEIKLQLCWRLFDSNRLTHPVNLSLEQ